MSVRLPGTVTPKSFSQAVRDTLEPLAARISGRNGKIDPGEARRALSALTGPELLAHDALEAIARSGQATDVSAFVQAQVARAEQAAAVASGEGRLSQSDAEALPADLRAAFFAFRGLALPASAPKLRFSEAVLAAVMQSHGVTDRAALLEHAATLDDGNGYLKRAELEAAAESLRGPFSAGLGARIPVSWRGALAGQGETIKKLDAFLADERKTKEIYPPPDQVFAALDRTPLDKVKVVLIGQDPYHGPGEAHGLSFSVPDGVKIPPSLRNIIKELQADVGGPAPTSGNLEKWADQGVLLLNTSLTVEKDKPASHAKKGWEELTAALLDEVNKKGDGVVFFLLGGHAQKVAQGVDTQKHTVVARSHPSPFSARNNFLGTKPFSAINAALTAAGQAPIDWSL